MSLARLLGEQPPCVLNEMRAARLRAKKGKVKRPSKRQILMGFKAPTFPPSDFPFQAFIEEKKASTTSKVPRPGTLTKSGLRKFMQHNRWDIIGAYFNFAPKFLKLPSSKPVFDWSSCPDEMSALLRQQTPREAVRQIERIRRAHAPNNTRLSTFNQQNGECWYCGEPTEMADWTIDHKIPRSRKGVGKKNKVGCCYNCNKAKGNMTVAEFLATDFLSDARRAILGASGAPAISYQAAKQAHHNRLINWGKWKGDTNAEHRP